MTEDQICKARRNEVFEKLRGMDKVLEVMTKAYDAKMKVLDIWVSHANDKLTKLMVDYDKKTTMSNLIAIVAILVSLVNTVLLVFIKVAK